MSEHGLDRIVAVTANACKRWRTELNVPDDADIERAGRFIRSAMMSAAKKAEGYNEGPFYPDDHSWSHNGLRGLTLARVKEEAALARSGGPSGEEWGIMARITQDDLAFDIPIALDLDPDSARNILSVIEGREGEFVHVESLTRFFDDKPFGLCFHAGNWANLREIAADLDMPIDKAFHFRRPVTWDLLRARLSELPIEPLPAFNDEEYYSRFAKSARYDTNLMESNRALVGKLACQEVSPLQIKWQEWHPIVIDLLNSIGQAVTIDGISIILNFVVEEPAAEQPEELASDSETGAPAYVDWVPVGFHNLLVCYGLHPLTAAFILDLVLDDPTPFFQLPPERKRRFRLLGASAIQDATLAEHRVSLNGRTNAYDRLVAEQWAPKEAVAEASTGFDMASVSF